MKKSKLQYYCLFLSMIIIMFVFGVDYTDAASFSLIGDKEKISTGESFQVDVLLDSENISINATGGSVIFDPNLFQVEKIMNGNSMVTFWVEPPAQNNATGAIDFSGIIPGGIITQNGYLFSVIFSSKQSGASSIAVSSPVVLKNDGSGSSLPVSSNELEVTISDDKNSANQNYDIIDTLPPEQFTIIRTQDNALFDNEWFIVYSTQDKGSGISQYEVCELLLKKCKTTNSPYELQNQSNWYGIYVKAHDNNNNVQYSFLVSKNVKIGLASALLLGILIITYGYFFKKKRKTF